MSNDFAFAYGGDEEPDGVVSRFRTVMRSLTPPVTLVDQQTLNGAPIGTLNEAIKYLASPAVTPPIGNLFLATHSSTFFVRMPMFPAQAKQNVDTEFETLQATITDPATGTPADADHTIALPPALIAVPPSHRVQIFGCNIGASPAFVIEWKQALGNNSSIDNFDLFAPKHFDGLSREDGYGYWESLAYLFPLYSPTKLSQAAMMAAFLDKATDPNGGFNDFIDGTPVPSQYWTDPKWYIPNVKEKRDKGVSMSLTSPIGTKRNIFVTRGLIKFSQNHTVVVEFKKQSDIPDPTNNDACKAAITTQLPITAPRFRAPLDVGGTPFPDYVRWGYRTVAEFVNGFTWTFKQAEPQNGKPFLLRCTGQRRAYLLCIPVTSPNPSPDPKVGQLLTNFRPKIGFNKVPPGSLPPDGIDITKGTLYLKV